MWNEAWPSQAIQRQKTALNALAATVKNQQPEVSDDVSTALARFLVVRTCGYVEQVVAECIRSYLSAKSAPKAAAYGASWLSRGHNPSPDTLYQLAGRFDPSARERLELLLKKDDELLSRELSFLVDRRNKIAHGLSESVGVRKALSLVDVADKIANWFILEFDPT